MSRYGCCVWLAGVVLGLTVTSVRVARAEPDKNKSGRATVTWIRSLEIVLTDPPRATFVLIDGTEYTPEHIEKGYSFPPPGRYRASKSDALVFHIHHQGRRERYWIRGQAPGKDRAAAKFRKHRGTFVVRISLPGSGGADGADGNSDSDDIPGLDNGSDSGQGLDAAGSDAPARGDPSSGGGPPVSSSDGRVRGAPNAQIIVRVANQAQLADLLARLPAAQSEAIITKLQHAEILGHREAMALLDVFHPAVQKEQEDGSSLTDWKAWARFLDKHGHLIAGKFKRGVNRGPTLKQLEQYLARHRRYVNLESPPRVTGKQRRAQVNSEPDQIAAWNQLAPWERELWNEYWDRLPGATQPDVGRAPMRMTQSTRFLLALQMSTEYMPEGFRSAAKEMFNERTFLTIAATSMMLYVVAVVSPEPLFSKATAATITVVLLSVVGLNAIIDAATALYQLRKAAGSARSIGELDAAARVFGTTIGARGFEVIAALASYFIGARLPVPKVGTQVTPGGGAVAGGGGVAAIQVAVVDGMKIAWVDGQLIMLPVLAAATVGGGGGIGGSGPRGPPAAGSNKGGSKKAGRGQAGSGKAGKGSKRKRTPKAPSAKGTRVNTDKTGTWIGMRGEGVLIPKGTNWRIPFRGGRPNFRKFVKQEHRFDNIQGLRGTGSDTSVMLKAVIERFGPRYGFKTAAGARNWLNSYRTPYGKGLELHHSGPREFQLVPKAVHDATKHGGFPGSASQLRKVSR